MKIRRFTQEGIARFNEYLNLLEAEPTRLFPKELLEDSACSEVFGRPTEIHQKALPSRYAAGEYLYATLPQTDIPDFERDVGLWAWLTLFFFDQLCPANKAGQRKLRERTGYIPEPENYTRYYRHLLLGPFLIFRAHRDNPKRAMSLLCKQLPVIDDIVGQVAAYQELVSNPAIVELATQLYFDPATGTTKRGSGGKTGGSPRRLIDILRQFDVTWDLYTMTMTEFWTLLPKEFDRFRPAT